MEMRKLFSNCGAEINKSELAEFVALANVSCLLSVLEVRLCINVFTTTVFMVGNRIIIFKFSIHSVPFLDTTTFSAFSYAQIYI